MEVGDEGDGQRLSKVEIEAKRLAEQLRQAQAKILLLEESARASLVRGMLRQNELEARRAQDAARVRRAHMTGRPQNICQRFSYRH